MRKSIAMAVPVVMITAISMWTAVSAGPAQVMDLVAGAVGAGPVVDGVADGLWNDVEGVTATVVGGANAGNHRGTVKSGYTASDVYFLIQWDDATHSLQRLPWQKQEDGTWLHLNDGSDHDENQFYEDKFAFIWEIGGSINGFGDAGCMVTCHTGEGDKAYGNKYTATPGERGDIWHWKSVRSGSIGYVDDQYLDDRRYADDNTGAGRHSDPKTVGGYVNNVNEAGDGPAFMGPMGPDGPTWIRDEEKMAFVDNFEAGDEIPGIIVKRPDGDRGQIDGVAEYAAGQWTLEIRRALVTGSEFDVQFADLGMAYPFGVAVFDNAQVRHSFQTSVSQLSFAPRPTLVADRSWGEIKAGIDDLR